jgi:outer membrane lipoprotein SlyB
MRFLSRTLPVVLLAAVAGCSPDYSPNTYASNAVQQANKVESAVVVGYRQVKISASGTVGAVSGGAAGGLLGAQAEPSGIVSALGTVGGSVVGGLVGTTVEHVAGDTTGWEYIVRKANGDMLSVTQRQETPIPLGQKVLVITGNQARIVPDYSVAADPPPATTGKEKTGDNKDENKEKVGEKAAPSTAPAPPVAASTLAPAPPTPAPATASAPASEAATPGATPALATPAATASLPVAASPAAAPAPDKSSALASTPQEAAAPSVSDPPAPAATGGEAAPHAPPP